MFRWNAGVRDRLKCTLDINPGNYVNAILRRYGLVNSRSVSTPGTGKPLDLKLGPLQQAAMPRNYEKSHQLIDVYTLGHCPLHISANSGDEQPKGLAYGGREEGARIP